MVLTLLSLLIFALYLFLVLRYIDHVPASLSETYYLIPHGYWFTFMMWAISFTLLPAMLDITPDNKQFLIFLALASICFVGTAPNFQEKFEGKVHVTSAVFAAFFGLSWALVMPHGFIALGISVFGVLVAALTTDTIRESRTFWLEMIAFAAVYLTAIFNLL